MRIAQSECVLDGLKITAANGDPGKRPMRERIGNWIEHGFKLKRVIVERGFQSALMTGAGDEDKDG